MLCCVLFFFLSCLVSILDCPFSFLQGVLRLIDWSLLNIQCQICYHDYNKFNNIKSIDRNEGKYKDRKTFSAVLCPAQVTYTEIIMVFLLYYTNMLNLIMLIVLSQWNNCPRVDVSLHSSILSWFRGDQSILLLLQPVCLVGKQQIPFLLSLVWPDRGSSLRTSLPVHHWCSWNVLGGIVSVVVNITWLLSSFHLSIN
jgi:hypothetical protein